MLPRFRILRMWRSEGHIVRQDPSIPRRYGTGECRSMCFLFLTLPPPRTKPSNQSNCLSNSSDDLKPHILSPLVFSFGIMAPNKVNLGALSPLNATEELYQNGLHHLYESAQLTLLKCLRRPPLRLCGFASLFALIAPTGLPASRTK